MALPKALYTLLMAASIATASATVGYDVCLETCTTRATLPCTEDSLPALIDCLSTKCTKEAPLYRNTTSGVSTESSSSYSHYLTSICGVKEASEPPYKANSTQPEVTGPTAAAVNATLLPSPTYSPVTWMPNNTAAHDAGVGASGMVAMVGVAALLSVL